MDRLSNLPDPICHQILSSLPTKDALRTCVLSTHWRYISLSLPKLEFRLKSEIDKSNFTNCVYRTLSSHDETDLQSLLLEISFDDKHVASSDLSSWVSSALNHKVQRFYLDLNYYDKPLSLPCNFFQCDSLQFLSFEHFRLRIPSRIRFSNLRILVLETVHFPDQPDDIDFVNKLFHQTTLPVLEALDIKGCPQFHTLCISIPSLVKLKLYSYCKHQRVFVSIPSLRELFYVGCPLEVCPRTLASLKKGVFEFPRFSKTNTDASDIPTTDASDILFGLCDVETLCLHPSFIESLSDDQLFFKKSPILSASLKYLHLDIYPTKKHVQVARFLLKCFPKLQAIYIYYSFVMPEDKLAEDEFVLASDFYFEGVYKLPSPEIIKICYFGGTEAERDLVLYLLQLASDLTKVKIIYKPHVSEPQISDMEKLLTLPRRSV